MTAPTRSKVLGLYRSILKAAREWKGGPEEQEYIRREAATLFRRNMHLADSEQIAAKVTKLALCYAVVTYRPD